MLIDGTNGNDIFKNYYEDDTYNAKQGDDIIKDYWGNDTYLFNLGDGNDTITDTNGNDSIKFGTGITKSNLDLSIIYGNTLSIKIKNTNDSITIINWSEDKYKIEQIQFSDGSSLNVSDINNILNGNKDITGTEGADIINGTKGNDTIYALGGNDTIYGFEGDDIIDGGTGADKMKGGAGNDTYIVDNVGDIVDETTETSSNSVSITGTPPDTSWISSAYLKDIYSRTYPRVMGNQWSVTPDGMLLAATKYTTDTNGNTQIDKNATTQENNKLLDLVTTYLDYITLNRVGTRTGSNDYNDIFLDNYDSVMNPQMGLLKTKNDIYSHAAANNSNRVYVLPYLSIADVYSYESINNFPSWKFWQSQKYYNGENFGSYDFANRNNLFLKDDSGAIVHYYGGTNTDRPLFDSRNPILQQYYIQHATDIVKAGFDGIFSDNWWRSKSTGDLYKLTNDEFYQLKVGWNTIGSGINNNIGDAFLIGNSPPISTFNSRDVVMLEDRIDDVVGTADESIASYFKYSDAARSLNQVCQDTYWDDAAGPFETFRIPMNLLTDNILGLGSSSNTGTNIQTYILPLKTLGELGYPTENRHIVAGTTTGTYDVIEDYSLQRAVYERDYTNGLVYLNDTLTQQTVKLPEGQWLRSDGVLFSGGNSITLDSARGWVFKKQDGSQPVITDAGGIDLVNSSISYSLGKYVEKLTLTGNQDINAVGNELNNIINGNSANNTIDAKAGNDILNGGAGNDTYIFSNGYGQDIVYDTSGTDKIKFGANIIKDNLDFSVDNKNVVIKIKNSSDSITVQSWLDGNKIETLEFYNNTTLSSDEVETNLGLNTPTVITPTIVGTDSNDLFVNNNGNDIYYCKKGFDRIKDYSGNDTYLFNRGDDWDSITDTNGNDTIIFGAGISKRDLNITRNGNDLQLAINGTNDGLSIINWAYNAKYKVETVKFNDGSSLASSDIDNIIQNIASYNASSDTQYGNNLTANNHQSTLPELVATI